jgi:hypothetical protein
MAPVLDDIPNELFERIVEQLDARDIFALRLGSRLLASKATQRTFKAFLRIKHVHLDEWSLTELVHATRPGGIGDLVENLVLVGLVTDLEYSEKRLATDHYVSHGGYEMVTMKPSLESVESLSARRDELCTFRDSKEDLRLLSEAFCNLSRSIAPRCLPCLSLQIGVHYLDGHRHDTPFLYAENTRSNFAYDPRFDLIREAAEHTFRIIMESLTSSSLTVKKLDLFNGSGMQPCSLSTTVVNNVEGQYPGLSACFAPMESLSISLCNPKSPEDDADEAYPTMPDESNTLGLGQLLQLPLQLSHLDVHYFIQGNSGHERIFHPRALMRHAAACSNLPNLQSCRISGLHCDTGDLLLFLQRTKPKCVTLENIIALSETWRPVLEFLTSSNANIRSLCLDDLFELGTPLEGLHLYDDSDLPIGTKHLWFDGSGPTKYGGPEMAAYNSTVVLQDDAVKHRLDYHFKGDLWSLPLGWSQRRLLKYGSI